MSDANKKRRLPLIVGGLILLGCSSLFVGRNLIFELGVGLGIFAPDPVRQFVDTEYPAANWNSIYFTNPACPPENRRRHGLDEIIADDMLAARSRVDVAAFELNAPLIVNALTQLAREGKAVRVVVDSAETDAAVMDKLRRAGAQVAGDDRSALMHNKFVIIDDEVVWTGSLNYTTNGSYCNANNAVRFTVPELALNYRAEMDEMVDELKFGPTSPDDTPNEQFSVEDIRMENYFASEQALAPIIADYISQADEEILFLAYSFTNEEIGDALMAQGRDGLTIGGVFETTGSETEYSYYNQLNDLRKPNVRIRQDGSSSVMHHKVFILDRKIVIFGSFNFTNSANDSNDENLVIVRNPAFADQFVQEFDAVWRRAPGLDDLLRSAVRDLLAMR